MTLVAQFRFRVAVLGLALVLGVLSLWMLVGELVRPAINSLPIDAKMAVAAAVHRNRAVLAARFGVIRGDLWSEAAFTYADLLWADSAKGAEESKTFEQARATIVKALTYAPHRADVWILLAGLEARLGRPTSNPVEALRLSYYTGPNELQLMPLRLHIATQSDASRQDDIQQFIRRDLQIIITREPQLKPAIIAAYRDATRFAKQLIEQVIGENDPTFLQSMRTGPSAP